jgi:hypothetical protein
MISECDGGTCTYLQICNRTLLSEEAGWITGQLIAVDGGASLTDASLPLEIQQAVPQSATIQGGSLQIGLFEIKSGVLHISPWAAAIV